MAIDLDAVRRVINPPAQITSMYHLRDLIDHQDCHSVVEGKFYDDILPIFAEISGSSVPGDILAAGVWKGGSAAYLQALNLHFGLGKRLWLSDTFSGFDRESIRHDKDRKALVMFAERLKRDVSRSPAATTGRDDVPSGSPPDPPRFPTPGDVERLFRSCGVWSDNVVILEGPLERTLPEQALGALALVHLDVDFYEPTRTALELTYGKLQVGGYVIIDDYGVEIFNCKDAVDDFRTAYGVNEPLRFMTRYVAYWKKERHV